MSQPMTVASPIVSPAASLEEAIAQQINLGLRDPLSVSRRIVELYGTDWLTTQLSAYAEDLIAEMARQRMRGIARTAEAALRPESPATTADLHLVKYWIPEEGWIRAADLTIPHLEARARYYDSLARGSLVRASWLRDVIDLMKAEGVECLGDLKTPLPALPDADLQELVAG